MADEIVTCAEARAQGLKWYFTGLPCKHGHVSKRLVKSEKCCECSRIGFGRYYQRNREDNIKKVQAWRERNWDRYKQNTKKLSRDGYWRDWRNNNLDKAREYERRWYAEKHNKTASIHNRRARKKESAGFHTADDLRAILTAQGHRCAYCRSDFRKAKRHLDHVIPLALGGTNDKANLQYLCQSCNLFKGAKDPYEYARERGLLL